MKKQHEPKDVAQDIDRDFDSFQGFMRKLVSVQNPEIKARLEAAQAGKRKLKASRASLAPDAS